MAEPRNYIRRSTAGPGFDGATVETATYVQNKIVWTTTTASVVGVFPPAVLGRVNTASQVRLAFEGTIDPDADLITVTDSTGGARYTAPVSKVSSGWLFLAPQDSLVLRASGATKVDILVRDLNGEEIDEYALTEATEELAP